jgi:hypothetical protein
MDIKGDAMTKKNLILNSTLLFSIATVATMTLHEGGHFMAAVFFHAKEVVLYHNYTSYKMEELSLTAQLLTVAAGPLFSLLLGIVFNILCSIYSKRNLLFLFLLYMSAFGYIAFGGYLMIAPLFANGDTGFIFNALHFPMWLIIIIALGGVAFMLYRMKRLSRYFVELATEEIIKDKAQRRAFFNTLIKFPLYFGIMITTLLNFPVTAFISLAYPLFSPLNLLWAYGYCLDANDPGIKSNQELNHLYKVSPVLIIAFILSIIYNRLLVYGL